MVKVKQVRWHLYLVLITLFGFLFIGLGRPANADVPLAVGLTSFDVFPLDNAVRLEWKTETEIGTVAFIIKRAVTGSNNFVWLTNLGISGYIISEGGPDSGYDYVVTDNTAVNGITYTYQLYEIESNSSENFLDELTVTAGIPTPTNTPTPIVIVGPPGGSTPLPTQVNTRVPATATPTATATSATVSLPPSATPSPTLTGLPRVGNQPTNSPTATPNSTPVERLPVATRDPDATPVVETGAGVEVALAQPEPTSEGYPGPDSPTPADDSGYPAGQPPTLTVAPPISSSPYPAGQVDEPLSPVEGEETINHTPVPVIGSQSGPGEQLVNATPAPGEATIGRVYLWGGCLLALAIFIAAVIGSIKLFSRKRE